MSHASAAPSSVVSRYFLEGQQQQAGEIVHSTLPGLLPDGYRLAVHRQVGTVTVLTCEQETGTAAPLARLTHQQTFTPAELAVLLPLLTSYPDYCPNEVLLASAVCGPWHAASEEDVAAARKRLQRAARIHTSEQMLKPMRNVLSRVRLKLHTLGITITSLLETGYQLMLLERVRVSSRKREKQAPIHRQTTKGVQRP